MKTAFECVPRAHLAPAVKIIPTREKQKGRANSLTLHSSIYNNLLTSINFSCGVLVLRVHPF